MSERARERAGERERPRENESARERKREREREIVTIVYSLSVSSCQSTYIENSQIYRDFRYFIGFYNNNNNIFISDYAKKKLQADMKIQSYTYKIYNISLHCDIYIQEIYIHYLQFIYVIRREIKIIIRNITRS